MERLKAAIEKARAKREALDGAVSGTPSGMPPGPRAAVERPAAGAASELWAALEEADPDDRALAEARIVSWKKSDPAHVVFDVLRTRLGGLLRERGWRRVAITSPGKNDGKTTLAVNLAMSFARQAGVRTLLVDFDLKAPHIADTLGLGRVPLSLATWLHSGASPKSHFIRIGENLAVGLNTERARNSAELIQDPATARRLTQTIEALKPDVVIYDLPPLLVSDDALAFLPQVDCTALVAAAGRATADEIRECERLLAGQTEFLGVILNKCEKANGGAYRYYDYDQSGQPAEAETAA